MRRVSSPPAEKLCAGSDREMKFLRPTFYLEEATPPITRRGIHTTVVWMRDRRRRLFLRGDCSVFRARSAALDRAAAGSTRQMGAFQAGRPILRQRKGVFDVAFQRTRQVGQAESTFGCVLTGV
jgi:hypothetical protein